MAKEEIDKLIKTLGSPGLFEASDKERRHAPYLSQIWYMVLSFFGASNKERREAAYQLGYIKDPRAVPALLKALEDSDMSVRVNAANALGEIGDPRAVPALIEALKRNDVRICTINAIGKIGDPRAVPALIKALGDIEGIKGRVFVAEALGKINDPISLKALEYVMKNDSDEDVRKAAFAAAAKIRSSHGILEEAPTQKVSVEGDLKYIHIGDKIGTQVKDSFVQRSTIGASARKCPNCGREVEANEKFCLECGAKL